MSFLSNTLALLCTGACLASCLDAAAPEDTAVLEQKQIMLNQFKLEAILVNSLIGTPQNLAQLVSQPLSSAAFDVQQQGVLGFQLHDKDAQIFMRFLVGCALGPNDPPVVWSDPYDAKLPPQQWNGRLGLCSSWATEAPSDACLELVSACLLARENAEGFSVATSQRGAMLNGSAIPLSATVPAQTQNQSGLPIDSFVPCKQATTDASRECGFAPASSLVGVCAPGTNVDLSCAQGSAESVVRICDGHHGCDPLDSTTIVSASQVCNLNTQISFECPSGGSYTAMVGSKNGIAAPVVTLNESDGVYPATEAMVFDVREAAFYGTLLSSRHKDWQVTQYVDRLTRGVVRDVIPNAMPTPVSSAMWACADRDWLLPDAYLLHRLCAVIVDDEDQEIHLCAAQPVGTCDETIGNAPANVCASVDGAPVLGDGDFDDCKDLDSGVWHRPITVYLDHPCDVVTGGATSVCGRYAPALPGPQ
jgi:hypothetical protein